MATSASSSAPPKSVRYDVFINHRGPDTKQTLATSIYDTLKSLGVKVFLDEPELELGDSIPSEIQHAIATSFLHIAILSPRYAESTWCLEELSLMLNSGHKVIPVFNDVDVNDIRCIKRRYAQDFAKLEGKKRYRPEKIEDWKSALPKVSYLKGHIVNSDDGKGELRIITNYVLKHPKRTSFVVAEHPVGLDETFLDFESSVMKSSENVKIVGITGMGGCGKTTLAKHYYNKVIQSFYSCSFVCDVRDAPTKQLYVKQKQMFQDLGGSEDIPFDIVEGGKAILAEYLKSVRVFIIVENVDHQDQLESLLPTRNSFRHGSVFVVTSRDPGILISWGIPSNSIYRMKNLCSQHAMELFCWHAFQNSSPVDEFDCFVQKYLIVCKGLPLSIKVLGALVDGKCKEYWNAQLAKFSGSLHKDIKTILMVSFDALDEEEKEIFLDISCFFVGRKKDAAIIVWEESGWTSGAGSLATLVDKCLVEVDKDKCLRMHDLLRDLGKDISMTRSPYRLWSPLQITHIENQGRESVPIWGIKAQTDEFYEELVEFIREESGRGIKRRRGLKIVDVENNYFTEELAPISQGLVSLRWANFPHTSLPPWISLKKLRVLELCEASKLEEPWIDSDNPPVQLRVLKIAHAESFQRFPRSIGFLKNLKEIYLDGKGAPIAALPDEFCCLQSLERLEFVECRKLKTLPSKIGDLRNLQHLRLERCSAIDLLPEEFGHLQSLKYLRLAYCYNLKSLPTELSAMTNLESLELDITRKLMIPSKALLQLTSLHKLLISHCRGPTKFVIQPWCSSASFTSLKHLELCNCDLTRISISPHCCPSLQTLYILKNDDLVEISSLPVSVKSFEVMGCFELASISLSPGLVKLEHLKAECYLETWKIEGLEICSSLETLELVTSTGLPVIEDLKDMESLRVKLTADYHMSTLKTFLQSLNREKWPSKCEICAPAEPGAEEIVESFTFPGVTLVDSFDRYKIDMHDEDHADCGEPDYIWDYVFPEKRSANAAVMICLVLYPSDGDLLLWISSDIKFEQMELPQYDQMLYIGVFRVCSLEGQGVSFLLGKSVDSLEDDLVKKGILVMGEEDRIVDAFYELVQCLEKRNVCEIL